MKVRAVVASTFKDYENGWSYSESALRSLAESAPGKPVNYRKKKIGLVARGWYEDGKVLVEAEIDDADGIMARELFLVPGGLTDFDTVGDILDACQAHRFIFTDQPSDKTLAAYRVIN